MTLAVAEMSVQGVSARKFTRVVKQLCGLQVTFAQVSRAAAALDEELAAWRNRPLDEVTSLTLDARYAKGSQLRSLPQDRPRACSLARTELPRGPHRLRFPCAHRRRLRTHNGLERLNKKIKRHSRVATLFPNEASLLRLISAFLSEISDDWETQRSYLNMKAR